MSNFLGLNGAAELRNAFDRTYAAPPSALQSEPTEDLLAIRLLGEFYAIKLSEITGIISDRKMLALPSPIPELLGIAGIRGALIPVYSLANLLGHNLQVDPGRWLVLCGRKDALSLAFGGFEGYLRVSVGQIHPAEGETADRNHIREVIRTTEGIWPVVNIPAILETITSRYGRERVGM